MNVTTTEFIVLIERRRLRDVLAWALAALTLLAALFGTQVAHAQPPSTDRHGKLARELATELGNPATPRVRWARDVGGIRHVQAIVVSSSSDPEMSDLRNFVLRTGGSVHAVHPTTRAITVQIRAGLVQALAQRSDVVSVTPNSVTRRTASTLESITGALTSNVRSNSTKSSYIGHDGKNIGIAILDSGVMATHEGLMNSGNGTRIKANVSMLGTTQASWTSGVNSSTSLQPGSAQLASYEAAIDNSSTKTSTQDPYGHGTHVAAVAAT
jgi:subtilisin family serine protease